MCEGRESAGQSASRERIATTRSTHIQYIGGEREREWERQVRASKREKAYTHRAILHGRVICVSPAHGGQPDSASWCFGFGTCTYKQWTIFITRRHTLTVKGSCCEHQTHDVERVESQPAAELLKECAERTEQKGSQRIGQELRDITPRAAQWGMDARGVCA